MRGVQGHSKELSSLSISVLASGHLPWTTVKMEVHSHLYTGLQCQHYRLTHHLHLTADTQIGSLMICTCLLTL